MRYVKLINKYQIENPPRATAMVSNYHLATNALLADGYKPYDDSLPMPGDGQRYIPYYVDENNKIVRKWEAVVEPEKSYAEKRAAEYPPIAEYLDAMVKINSGDETLAADGQEQLNAYYRACLDVKARYPKPEEPLEV